MKTNTDTSRLLLISFVYGILFFLTAKVSLYYATLSDDISLFWIPSGISVSLYFFVKDKKFLIPIFFVSTIFQISNSFSVFNSILIGLANCSEALIAYELYKYLRLKLEYLLDYQIDLFIYPILALISPIFCSIIGASILHNTIHINFARAFISWHIGNGVAIFLILPLVLELLKHGLRIVDFIGPIILLIISKILQIEAVFPYYYFSVFIFFIPILFKRPIGFFLINLTFGLILFWLNLYKMGPFHFHLICSCHNKK